MDETVNAQQVAAFTIHTQCGVCGDEVDPLSPWLAKHLGQVLPLPIHSACRPEAEDSGATVMQVHARQLDSYSREADLTLLVWHAGTDRHAMVRAGLAHDITPGHEQTQPVDVGDAMGAELVQLVAQLLERP